MSSDIFDGQILAEKLSKLNNSQQSIESLSRWCISHRKKARQIVETWEKIFDASQKERRVSFLYLANDILQNSRRKGNEFVNEFWKALPAALKHVYENGDENGRKVVTRLVGIWEERKVFGSRGQSLKDDMLGKDPPPPLSSNGKSSNSSPNPSTNHNPNPNPIKIVKRDAQSVRIKLAVGGLPERIVTAFQSVLDEHFDEEAALNKCNDALLHVGKMRKDVENTSHLGNQSVSLLVDELQEQGNMLQQCVAELEGAEATRAKLISQLKEALQEQESKQEMIRTQLQMARHQIEEFSTLRERLTSPTVPGHSIAVNVTVPDAIRAVEQTQSPIQPGTTTSQPPLMPTNVSSYAPLKPTDEESKKAAAAAVAAKLAASTSSAQMLTSVLSSLVAEEALNSSFKSAGFTSGLPLFPPEKRPKLDMPIPVSDIGTSSTGGRSYFTPLEQQSGTSMPLVPPSTAMRSESQSSQLQAPFGSLPPLLPPSHLSTSIPQTNQFVQSTGMMVGTMPYSYGGNTLPPPPPLPPHVAMGLARPGPQPSQLSQPSQQSQQQQQSPATGGYYRPLGIGFFGPNNQAAPPPVPRQ